jgi:glycosyltransferase involved in cell wall biosynthesis
MRDLKELDVGSYCVFGNAIHGSDKEQKIRSAKAMVLPSLNEGMPLVILECLSQGTPVICFDVGYISDYLGKDYPGLVKELSDQGLEEKIRWLDNLSVTDYNSIRKQSFDLFWHDFSPEQIRIQTTQLFKSF